MKLTYAAYAKARDFTCLGSWCLLYGAEQHLKREALALMRAEVMAAGGDEGEGSWEAIDGAGASARDLLLRAQTAGLFGGARGVVVWQAERIDRKQQEDLAKAIAPLPPTVTVVLVTGEPRDKRDRGVRAPLARAIEEKGLAVDCPAMKAAEAARWAVGYAQQLGKRLEAAAAQKLAGQQIGTSLGGLSAEIEKLAAYVGERPAITAGDVEAVTPRLLEEDVFRLIDAVTAQSAGRAVAILRPMVGERREPPERILPLLAQAIREIWQVKLLMERGWRPGKEADDETKAMLPADPRRNALKTLVGSRDFLVSKRMQQAQAFTWGRLTRALEAAHGCDLAVKGISGKVTDNETALELLVVQLCTDVAMPVWEG